MMKSVWMAAGMAVLALAGCGGSEGLGAIPDRVVSLGGDANGDLAIDGANLIFTDRPDTGDDGFVLRATLDGSDQRALAPIDHNSIGRVAIGGGSVYASGSQLLEVPLAGGEPQSIGGYETSSSTLRNPLRIAADARGVWAAAVAHEGDSMVQGFDGGGYEGFLAPGVKAVAIDDTHVYWTTPTSLRRRPRVGAMSADDEILVDGEGSFGALAVTRAKVVWLDLESARVMAVDKEGGSPVVIAQGDAQCAFTMLDELAVDDTRVYWSMTWAPEEERRPGECFGRESILQSSTSGGDVVPISSRRETGSPTRLALGPDHVYYIDLDTKQVNRVPR